MSDVAFGTHAIGRGDRSDGGFRDFVLIILILAATVAVLSFA